MVSTTADHSVCDAGALALSKDAGPGDGSYGAIWSDYEGDVLERDSYLTALSQEHGKLSRPLPYGSRVRILPNHSCLTVACFDHVYLVRGEQVEAVWTVHRGRS